MPEPQSNPTTDDLGLMNTFVQDHGEAALDEKVDAEPNIAEPEAPEESEGDDFDAATLQALGLAPEEDEPSPSGDDGDGTTQPEVDLERLAQTLGLSPEDLAYGEGGLRLKTKVDGEVGEVSLDELRKGYQLQSHFTRQQEQFLAERKQWEDYRQQKQAEIQQSAELANGILTQEEQQLNQQYSLDWNTLRQEDPAEYAAKVAEYNQKLASVKNRRQQLHQQLQQHQQEAQQRMQQTYQQEAQQLATKMGWKDQESWQNNLGRLVTYMVEHEGIPPETVNTIVDHRAYLLAEKARLWDELQGKIATSRKKVKETHKVPSGAAPKPTGGKRQKAQAAMGKLQQTHSLEDAAAVFRQLGVVD